MKILLPLFCFMSFNSFAFNDFTAEGYSGIYYSNGKFAEIAESQMWKNAFENCSSAKQLIRISEVKFETVFNNEAPVGVKAYARFACD